MEHILITEKQARDLLWESETDDGQFLVVDEEELPMGKHIGVRKIIKDSETGKLYELGAEKLGDYFYYYEVYGDVVVREVEEVEVTVKKYVVKGE